MYFSRLIKCRERSPSQLFVTTKELEQYAEESVSSIYYLLAKIIKSESMDVDHALSHLGKAQGIMNMLRAQSRPDRSKGVCIPQETMLKHGVSQERILRNKVDDKGVQECVFEVASVANSHLEKVCFHRFFGVYTNSNLEFFVGQEFVIENSTGCQTFTITSRRN